jgi:predicted nucleic acid-binding protein
LIVLADTSVWIEHLRRGEATLAAHLRDGLVLIHPFVLGELACGNMRSRPAILSHLKTLPEAKLASNAEVLQMIEDRKLWGRGLGWVDVHLIASARLSTCPLWTLDKRLQDTAAQFGIAWQAIYSE